MRIENGKLVLNDGDIDKLVIYHLRLIESAFENRYDDIANGDFNTDNLLINSPRHMEQAKQECKNPNETPELKCVELYIRNYFEEIKNKRDNPLYNVAPSV